MSKAPQDIVVRCDLCGKGPPFLTLARSDCAEPGGVDALSSTCACLCGWVFKPDPLTAEELSAFYSTRGGAATHSVRDEEWSRLRSAELYSLLAPDLGPGLCRILDVGGGVGQAAQAFAANGHEVEVLDLAASFAIHPAMRVRRGDIHDLPVEERYDLILLNHVLEHVGSPMSMLRRAARHLNSDGRIFVEVPFELYTPFIRRRTGDPCHVGYFAKHTLRRFLVSAGLHVHWVRRSLGRYGTRRVMVLRALASKRQPNGESNFRDERVHLPLVRTVMEMFHPHQLLLALVRT